MIYKALALLMVSTSRPLHVRINGDGYLRFAHGQHPVYSKDVTLERASTGLLGSPEGYPLLPPIRVPASGEIKVGMDGVVSFNGKPLGHLCLSSFGKPLSTKEDNYFIGTGSSTIGYPGEGMFGVIENANAKIAQLSSHSTSLPQLSKTKITVAAHTEVDDEHILLGNIAHIEGAGSLQDQIAKTDLGSTPIYGAQRGIATIYILSKLRNEGIKTDNIEIECPYGATVLRKGQQIDQEQLISAAADAAKTKLGIDYALKMDRSIPSFFVPTGQLQLVTREATSTGDGASVTIEVDVDGKSATTRTLYLSPAVPLPQVRAGDPIKIRVMKNGATVEIAGTARSTAKVGATITVQTETGAAFSGILKSPSYVEVKL